MLDNNLRVVFSGSIPLNYETYLGPVLFEPYAIEIAARIKKINPKSLLEIACGTGRLTKHLPSAAADSAVIIASDINASMLVQAQKMYPELNVKWQVADAMNLLFNETQFDCVAEQFGIMFCDDKVKAFEEIFRVLDKNGVLIFSAWDKLENNQITNTCNQVMPEFFPVDTPAFFNLPHSYYDENMMRQDLMAAGFFNIQIENIQLKAPLAKAVNIAKGFTYGTPLYNVFMEYAPQLIGTIEKRFAEKLTENFGEVFEGNLSAFIITAKK